MSAQVFEMTRFAEEIGAIFGWFSAENAVEQASFDGFDPEMSAESHRNRAKMHAALATGRLGGRRECSSAGFPARYFMRPSTFAK